MSDPVGLFGTAFSSPSPGWELGPFREQMLEGPRTHQEPGDRDPSQTQQASLGFLVCEVGTRTRQCPAHRQASGGSSLDIYSEELKAGKRDTAGYLERPAGGGWGPGSRVASSGHRTCGSGGAGP